MKKFFTLLAALLLVGMSASAKSWTADLSKVHADGSTSTYNVETHELAWTAGWSNSALFEELSGDLSMYDTFKVDCTISDGTEGYRLLVYEKGNTTAKQIHFTASGEQIGTFADNDISKEFLENFDYIRISGKGGSGSVIVNSFILEGPDEIVYEPINLYPASNLTKVPSADTRWANISFPFTFKENGDFWASHDNNADNYADVSGYESLSIVVSSAVSGSIRAFLWDDETNSRKIVFFHPAEQYDTVENWEEVSNINAAGTYKVSLCGCTKLLGVKWNWGTNNVVVVAANLEKAGDKPALAVNEARTFSSKKCLDFTDVTDVKAYYASWYDGEKLTMTQVTGKVPANVGLVLVQNSDKAVISIPTCAEGNEEIEEDSYLTATTEETTLDNTNPDAIYYVLAGSGDKLGWYKVGETSVTLAAGKAFFATMPTQEPDNDGLLVKMSFNEETAISTINASNSNIDAIYNINGQRVSKAQKGLYIVNGKKVLY